MRHHTVKLSFCAVLALLVLATSADHAHARAKSRVKKETPKSSLVIKDYKWATGGMGRPGILKSLTLENTGKRSYKNIEIEANFYSRNDVPQGSLRTTIRDMIEPGATKTFTHLNFGLMHSDLERTELAVKGAKTVSTGVGAYIDPSELVAVKGWAWSGPGYGTAGILETITIENRSDKALKNIEILIEYLGGGIQRSYERAFIQGIIPPNATKTFENVNINFRNPDSTHEIITVVDADIAVEKKVYKKRVIRRRVAADEGAVEVTEVREVLKDGKTIMVEETRTLTEAEMTATQKRRAEILRKKTPREAEPPSTEVAPPAEPTTAPPVQKKTGMVAKTEPLKQMSRAMVETTELEEDEYIEITEEVAVPDQDLVIKGFKVRNTIPNTIGYFNELTIENKSTITYRDIDLVVDFYSRRDNRPLGSMNMSIPDILPPRAKRKLKNVKIGFLNLQPEVVVVRIIDAKVLR